MEVLNDFFAKNSQYGLERRLHWRTDVVQYENLTEQRNQVNSRPYRTWKLPYLAHVPTVQAKIEELFQRAGGRYRVFLYKDWTDYAATYTECSITAIAAQLDFQLIKTYYPSEAEAWTENKTRIVPGGTYAPTVKVDNVAKTEGVDYTLDDDTGIVTFGVAPGAGKVITADYQFYYPVRFGSDQHTITAINFQVWSAGNLELMEVVETP